jgi:hypothetical protein
MEFLQTSQIVISLQVVHLQIIHLKAVELIQELAQVTVRQVPSTQQLAISSVIMVVPLMVLIVIVVLLLLVVIHPSLAELVVQFASKNAREV